MRRFHDRREAGELLAGRLAHLAAEHPVVLGLPRGGVPVAFEVARALQAPLDVIVVRKLGVPFQPELGMGAVGEGGERILNAHVIALAGVTPDEVARVEERERAEVEARARRFRGRRPPVPLDGRTVVVVDDGVATGGTARAALHIARARGAARVVLAVPVGPPETTREFARDADEVVVLETPEPFYAIGQWYVDFSQVPDERVAELLAAALAFPGAPVDGVTGRDEEVEVEAGPVHLAGHLTVPAGAIGLVLFAHGSGSSRHSPRNRFVARALHAEGVGTLLFDLLTREEELARANVFDVDLLAGRLAAATRWACTAVPGLPIGYFGASTGAAAALRAAADEPARVAAVVSRGGRPDLAAGRLGDVRAPTLLVVGGRDDVVLALNREAARELRCEHAVEVVPGATHLFEEPGTLEQVARLAGAWFHRHLAAAAVPPG